MWRYRYRNRPASSHTRWPVLRPLGVLTLVAAAASLSSCGGGSPSGEICTTDASTAATSAARSVSIQAVSAQAATTVRWSDPASGLPRTKAALNGVTEVVIPKGVSVILDMSPPDLPALNIQGTLTFEDTQDVSLRAASILLSGKLQIGAAATPFSHQATITLTGLRTNTDTTVVNDGLSRGLNVRGGTLLLYGQFNGPAWVQLDKHLPAASTDATLNQSVNWRSGDLLAVAPTDFYGQVETERVRLAADANGKQISLANGLRFARWGRLQYVTDTGMKLSPQAGYTPPATPASTVLDERAEVGNLSRRIVIQGANDTEWTDHGFGAHVMVMGLDSKVVVDGVEMRRVGQAGKLGRYPMHWHLLSYDLATGAELGDATGHIIRNSAIWDSAQRCIVLHATNGVTVQNNICHDIKGHAIFLEDAVERRNVIQDNLVLKVRSPDADKLLKIHEGSTLFQAGPSGVWMTNPDNTLSGNHAGDAYGNGFWLSFPLHSLGLSRAVPLVPKVIRLGSVQDNTAHSTGGPGQLMEWVPVDDAVEHPETTLGTIVAQKYAPMNDDLPCYDGSGNFWDYCTRRTQVTVKRSTLYKNGILGNHGAYRNRVSLPSYQEWVTADNAGTHFAGAADDGLIQRALIVGKSLNVGRGYPSSAAPPVGLATYHSSVDMAWNTFVNFPFVKNTSSGAFMTDDYYIRPLEKGTVRNEGNRLINSHAGYRSLPPMLQKVHNRAENWALSGALWDPYGYWGPARNFLVFNVPFLTTGKTCVNSDGNTAGDGLNGVSCEGPYYGVSSFQTDVEPGRYTFSAALHVQRQTPSGDALDTWNIEDGYTSWTDAKGVSHACDFHTPPPKGKYCSWKLGWMRHFTAVPSGRYLVEFPTHARPPRYLAFNIENAYRESDDMLIAVPFDGRYTAAGYHIAGAQYNREYPLLNPSGNPESSAAKPTATRYLVAASSLAQVRADTTGKLMWQDKANNLVWLRYTGTAYSAQAQAALAGRSEDGLYYVASVVLHPQGACTGLTIFQFDACMASIQAMQP
jgi:hypothetical protein